MAEAFSSCLNVLNIYINKENYVFISNKASYKFIFKIFFVKKKKTNNNNKKNEVNGAPRPKMHKNYAQNTQT